MLIYLLLGLVALTLLFQGLLFLHQRKKRRVSPPSSMAPGHGTSPGSQGPGVFYSTSGKESLIPDHLFKPSASPPRKGGAQVPQLDLLRFTVPNLGEIPQDYLAGLDDLLNLGKEEVEFDLYGYRWTMGTLWEWEEREIESSLSGYDIGARIRLQRVEVLNRSITKIVNPYGHEWHIETALDRAHLRNLLLSLDPNVLIYLYNIYVRMREVATRRFERNYNQLEEVFKQPFFRPPDEDLEVPGVERPDGSSAEGVAGEPGMEVATGDLPEKGEGGSLGGDPSDLGGVGDIH